MGDKNVEKICVVCGDIATALTCKSCKPFFRRNAIKNEILKCDFGDNCQITIRMRRRCRKCRLDKCFAVGMRKELILSDVEKHFRRSFIYEKRKERQSREEKNSVNETIESQNEIVLCSSVSITSEISVSSDMRDEIYTMVMSTDSTSDLCSQIQTLDNNLNDDQIIEIESFLSINEMIRKSVDSYKPTIDLVLKPLSIPRPLNHFNKHYTELEEYRVMELFHSFRPILNSCNKKREIVYVDSIAELPRTNNVFYEREIKILIESVKNMNVFENICENDRITLVKYSCIDILLMRAVIQCFDYNNEFWTLAMDENRSFVLKLDVLKTLKNDVFTTYRNCLYDIIKECDSDTVILDLLSAIALFNPNRPNLVNVEFVRVQQQFYLYLLQRYLTLKYRTKSESELKSAKLLNTLINVHILSELEKKYFVGDYQEQYGPLVKEVFDL